MRALTFTLLLSIPFWFSPEQPSRQSLPVLPDSVYSALGWVPVHRSMTPCGSADNFGCLNKVRLEIEVRDSMALSVSWETLIHEQVHLHLFIHGINLGPAEEHVADVLAAGRVGEMLH